MSTYACPGCGRKIPISPEERHMTFECAGCARMFMVEEPAPRRHLPSPGLVATLASLGGIILLTGAGLAAWRVTWPTKGTTLLPAAVSAVLPLAKQAPADNDVREKILHHSFWRVKVTDADLDRIVKMIQEQHAGDVVWVDDGGVVKATGKPIYFEEWNRNGLTGMMKPGGMSNRYFWVDMGIWQKHPSDEEVLKALLGLLDAADFAGS